MATDERVPGRPGDDVPGVNPAMKKSVDPSYHPDQHGSVPLETVSVKKTDERNPWPAIWAVTTIVMVLIALYLFVA